VFGKRVLRGIFGRKRDKVIGRLRKLHNVELHNMYSPLSKIRMINSWRIRCERHVARMGRREMHMVFGGKA
jgi:hypothetical protein